MTIAQAITTRTTILKLAVLTLFILVLSFAPANNEIRTKYIPEDMMLINGNGNSIDFYISTHEVTNYEYIMKKTILEKCHISL